MKKTPRWSLIPYAVVCCCASGLAAQGTWAVGKPIAVSPRPPDPRTQGLPTVACDAKGTFLVAWQQGQDFYQQQSADILAARVSAGGRLLDAAPLVLCAAPDSQLRPRVAFSNGVFLAVWQDLRNGKDFDVYGARVSPDGKVLDKKNGFLIAGGPHNQALPDIAPAPGGFLVIWQDYRNNQGYELYATQVAASGKAGQSQALRKDGHGLHGGGVSVTSSGEGWFVFWISLDGRPKAARLRMAGGALQVAEISGRLPNYSGQMGQPASNGRKVLYAGSAIHGRGGGFKPGTGLLFDPGSCRPLPNPNPPVSKGASGWNEKVMICLHVPMPSGVDAPVACAAVPDGFLIAAKGSSKAKPPHSRRILAAWLPNSGQRATDPKHWIVVHDGPAPARSPAAAVGKRAGKSLFLVAYSVSGKDGASIQARLLQRP